MQFKKATRKQAKLRLEIQGPSGSGKTTGALIIATALSDKVAFIDTEYGSASLYSDKYNFDVLELDQFSPEHYVQAIKAAEANGYEVCIVDSMSHEWQYILEQVDKVANAKFRGNTYAAWSDLTPRHDKLVQAILQSKMHIIACSRSKTEYVETEKKGRKSYEKQGTKAVQREGLDYEFTIVFELSIDKHLVNCTKDRTSLFIDRDPFTIDQSTAKELSEWLAKGAPTKEPQPKNAKPDPRLTKLSNLLAQCDANGVQEFTASHPDSLVNMNVFEQTRKMLNSGELTPERAENAIQLFEPVAQFIYSKTS